MSLLFLFYCFFDCLFYAYLQKSTRISGIGTLDLACYSNIFSFLLLTPYIFYNKRRLLKNFKNTIPLSILIIAPFFKLFAAKYTPLGVMSVSSFLVPIATIILSFLILKEFDKKDIGYYIKSIISMIGVFYFISFHSFNIKFIYILLFVYILIKAFYNILIKKNSENSLDTLCYIKFYYLFVSIIYLTFFLDWRDFDLYKLIDNRVMTLSFLALGSYMCLILSYKLNKVSNLQSLKYIQILFALLLGKFMLGDEIHKNQIIGVLIITIGNFYDKIYNFLRKIKF